MNALPKIAFSSTLTHVEWSKRARHRPADRGGIPELKGQSGKDIPRLWVLHGERFEVHARGGDPLLGTGRNRRVRSTRVRRRPMELGECPPGHPAVPAVGFNEP
jgi:hypothetical protein